MRRIPLLAAALVVALPAAGCDHRIARPAPEKIDYTAWVKGTSTPVADPLYPVHGNAAVDVLHYDLKLSWVPDTLTGLATLQIRPVRDAPAIELDFKPYELDEVTVDNAPVAGAEVTGERLMVPVKLTKDNPVTLTVAYHGKPGTTPMPSHRNDAEPLGLTITDEGGLYTMQEPFGAFTWYPANDQPSDKALYDVAVTVPAGFSAIAAGTPTGQRGTTFTYRSLDPMSSYLQTLAVGKYRKIEATGPHGIPLSYWYRAGTDEKMLPSLRKSPDFLAFLEKRFGPYPFPTGGIVLVDSPSGMETQQMITMGRELKRFSAGNFEEDLLHEYAHQWFGDAVTTSNWTDLWLNEGWAMYVQLLWQQEKHHYSDDVLEDYLRTADARLRKQLGPPGHPKAANFAESNVYFCAAAMLKELNDALGDEKFFALGRAWVQTQKGSQQDRRSFTAFVNAQTGRDFTTLIDGWLDAPRTPGP